MVEQKKPYNIIFLVTDGFEEEEYRRSRAYLETRGIQSFLVSPAGGQVRSWQMVRWGNTWPVDFSTGEIQVEHYDGIILPGSFKNPELLGGNHEAMQLVKSFFSMQKIIGAICQGPSTLAQAQLVNGYALTSWPALKRNIEASGGLWQAQPVIWDRTLVTAQTPTDIPLFSEKFINLLQESRIPSYI